MIFWMHESSEGTLRHPRIKRSAPADRYDDRREWVVNSGMNHYSLPRHLSDFSVHTGSKLTEPLPEPYRTIFEQAAIGIAGARTVWRT